MRGGLVVVVSALLLFGGAAVAMQLPEPGEIERLKESGEFENRKKFAEEIGNHKIDPELVKRAVNKAKKKALRQQGFTANEADQMAGAYAPPPAWSGMPTTGSVKLFALLIDFSDYPAVTPQATVHDKLFGAGNPAEAPYESLAAFYSRSSYGLLDFSGGTTLGWYRPGYSRSAVTQTPAGRENLIKEALNYFNTQGHDFSQYDNNSDGKIDYFLVIWTGPAGPWASFWWGYATSFSDFNYLLDGKRLGKYSWQWEGSPYGQQFGPLVTIHETGHALGLPDYYDYSATAGPKGGVGGLDMMDHNWGDHSAFSKWVLDWIDPVVVAGGSQTITLNPSATSTDAVLIMPGITSSDLFDEYFLVQNRHRAGNDVHYPNDGLLIWHVDATLNSSGTNYLYNNSDTARKLLRLMEADGLEEIEKNLSYNTADAGDYYVPGASFGPATVPSSRSYGGLNTGVTVTNITRSGNQVTAAFSIGAAAPSGTVKINGGAAATNSTTVTLNLTAGGGANPVSQMRFSNDDATWSAWEAYKTTRTGWTIPASDGEKTVYAQFRDNLQIESSSYYDTIDLDTVAPVAVVVANSPLAGPTKATTFGFGVNGGDVVSYKYKINSGAWSAEIPVKTSMNIVGLVNGSYTLSVVGKDAAGNWQSTASPTTVSWDVDTIKPVTTASPAGGTYAAAQTVTLSSSETATIYYTTNGTTPTTASPQYSGPITVTPTSTLKFFAVDQAGNAEAVKSLVYQLPPVAALTGVPAARTKATVAAITVGGATAVAYKFRLDNGTWSAETPIATKISLSALAAGSHTVDVIAKNALGAWQTTATTASWTVDLAAPVTTASLAAGIYKPGQTVSLSASETATVYYTTNGTTPTTASAKYSAPLAINTSTTLKFFAVDQAGNAEAIKTNIYTITLVSGTPPTTTKLATATLTVAGIGVSAYKYSLDGGALSAEIPVATKISLTALGTGLHTVSVIGKTAAGVWQVAPTAVSWTVEQTAPTTTASPAGGTYAASQTVTLTADETATIYYTITGLAPTTSSAKYTGPITVAPTKVLKFFAVDQAGNAEAVKTEIYALPVTAIIAGTPAAKTKYTTATLTVGGSGVVAYKRSVDGGAWSAETPVATKIALTGLAAGAHRVDVIAKNAAGGWQDDQAPTTVQWTVDLTPPVTTASPAGGTYATPQTVNLSADETATIYYTTNGTTPTTASAKYVGPIPLPATATLKYFAIDPAGNAEAVKTQSYALPPLAVINGVPVASKATSVTLTIGGVGVVAYKYKLDGGSWSAEIPVATKTAITGLSEGAHTVSVIGKSVAGTWQATSVASSKSWIVDLTAPTTAASLAAGVYKGGQAVTLSPDETATVYYTTNGTTPTTASAKYTAPLTVNATSTLKFFAIDTAGNVEAVKTFSYVIVTLAGAPGGTTKLTSATLTVGGSGVAAYKFKLDNGAWSAETPLATKISLAGLAAGTHTVSVVGRNGSGVWQANADATTASWTVEVAPPVTSASPAGGTYDAPQVVTLSANETATIYYTLTGAAPTTASSKYAAPVSVAPGKTLKFFAVDQHGNAEAVKTEIYAPSPLAVLSGTPATFSRATSATLTVGGTGVVAYRWKLDSGAWSSETPVATKIVLSGLASGSHAVAVLGKNLVGTWQDVPTAVAWTVDISAPVTTASVPGGTYASAQSVELYSSETATIYYTVNGAAPTTASPKYTGPIVIGTTQSLKYFAVDQAGNVEGVKAQSFTIKPAAVINGIPADPTTATTATFTVGGPYVVSYKYKLDNGVWSVEIPVTQARSLAGLADGTHMLSVLGKNAGGTWQTVETTAVWTIQ
ncbi:chitobiase/beta-hexosaminidase C-terminal domain-containing protein [Geobacter sulfurreducens]|nr:chitobiase/beta-hexosaminidase C-terminal domain-containing protein [Geobacter sulfurreducens]